MSDMNKVARLDIRGMITLRGDLASAKMKKAVKAVTGKAVPDVGRRSGGDDSFALWMSPDELLLMVPYDTVPNTIAQIGKALAGAHHLIADVSDARAVFSVSGRNARDVIAKVCPADLSDDAFPIDMVRRSRLAQVPAAFFRVDANTFELVCFLSVADYAHGVLQRSASHAPVVGFYS